MSSGSAVAVKRVISALMLRSVSASGRALPLSRRATGPVDIWISLAVRGLERRSRLRDDLPPLHDELPRCGVGPQSKRQGGAAEPRVADSFVPEVTGMTSYARRAVVCISRTRSALDRPSAHVRERWG